MKPIKVSSDKDINKYVKKLIGIGCKIERGSKHWKLSYKNSKKVVIPGTPSDRNSIFAFKREVRGVLRRELEMI